MDQLGEVWRPIPWRTQYEVSSYGRIRGPLGARSPKRSKDGYLRIDLGPRPRVTKTMQSLVAETFLGPRPPGLVVAHKNHIRDDNRVENLQYTTQRANFMHRRQTSVGTCPLLAMMNGKPRVSRCGMRKHQGEAHPRATTLSDDMVRTIHAEYASYPVARAIDKKYGFAEGTASHVIAGRSWRHLHPDATLRT